MILLKRSKNILTKNKMKKMNPKLLNYMNKNKTVLQRIWLGIKLGWKLPVWLLNLVLHVIDNR